MGTPPFVALPVGAAAAFILAVVCGPGHIDDGLAALSALVFVVGYRSTLVAGLGIAAIAWLLFIGFVVDGLGILHFGVSDWGRLALFVTIATSGWLFSVISAEFRNAHRRDTPPIDPYPGVVHTAQISFRR